MAYRLPLSDNRRLESRWLHYQNSPKERRMNVVSEYVTIFGEAPSGAHEIDKSWLIWKETRDANGRVTVEYAQNGNNQLQWIYNVGAFDPQPDQSGAPYAIQLDNVYVYDGMVAGLPVANITVLDIDDNVHTLEVVFDPTNHFTIAGNTLFLTNSVSLSDVAYPLKIKATDDDDKTITVPFAIIVVDPSPPPVGDFVGEVNIYDEATIVAGNSTTVLSYTVPANRSLDLDLLDCFGRNIGAFEVLLDGDRIGYKETYYTYFETKFDFSAYRVQSGQVISVVATNRGSTDVLFNARLRGYQFAD